MEVNLRQENGQRQETELIIKKARRARVRSCTDKEQTHLKTSGNQIQAPGEGLCKRKRNSFVL